MGVGGVMSSPNVISLGQMLRDKDGFMRAVSEHGHVSITNHGRFLVVAHCINNVKEAGDIIKQFAEMEICPEPGEPPWGIYDADRWWVNLTENVRNMHQYPREITLLKECGKFVVVLQNFVVGVEGVLIAMDTELMASLDSDRHAESVPVGELIAELKQDR